MEEMFCFQCEQTAQGKACTKLGVCGKKSSTANLQDQLTMECIALAKVSKEPYEWRTTKLIIDSLFTCVTNVSFNDETLQVLIDQVKEETARYGSTTVRTLRYLWEEQEDIRSLKSLLLFGLRGIAAYAHHAYMLNRIDDKVNAFFYEALRIIDQDVEMNTLLHYVHEAGIVNLKCMELLDGANTSHYGHPVPTKVSTIIEKGPFIVITGHDLHDLELLLKQSEGKGVNVYTHGEMLPGHGYPLLKQYKHLKGNFGTAWQNQQVEFMDIPAPVLFTTNCIMPVKENYFDRIYSTSVVSYPGIHHIDDTKDFTSLINHALELGGYPEEHYMTGINGGTSLLTGFGHNTVLSVAGDVVNAVKDGKISHFFLVGGCDGAKAGRNYFTEFVEEAPKDSMILTLACGKFRFNDLDLGTIEGLPRLLDMGQCNDSYSAIKVALALSDSFECTVNELPLTLILSWYEQKAVCVLLTLLALGIKNIHLGPTLPAFVSPNVLNFLVENYNIKPISTVQEDLNNIFKVV